MDNRDRGFTLIEVMIAMAVATVMFLGIMDMITAQNKAVRGTQNVSSSTGLQNLITQIIDNPNTCSALFNGISWKNPFSAAVLGTQWPPSALNSFTLTGGNIQAVSWAWSPTATNVTYGSYLNIPEPSTQYPLLTNLVCQAPCNTAPYTITGYFTLWPVGVGGNTSATGAGAVPMQIQVPFQAQVVLSGGDFVVGNNAGQCGASTSVGNGTQNILAKWTSGTQLGNSNVEETGTNLLTVGAGGAENTTMNGTLTVGGGTPAGSHVFTVTGTNPISTFAGPVQLSTAYATGGACTSPGQLAFDPGKGSPIYCSNAKKWATMGLGSTISGYVPNWLNNTTPTGTCGKTSPPGAGWAAIGSVPGNPQYCSVSVILGGGGNGKMSSGGCYYDPSTWTIYVCSNNSFNGCSYTCIP